MNKQNKTMEEERRHPIFEDCEVMNNGKAEVEYMLSLNGMYISGITHAQLQELADAVVLALHPKIKK